MILLSLCLLLGSLTSPLGLLVWVGLTSRPFGALFMLAAIFYLVSEKAHIHEHFNLQNILQIFIGVIELLILIF